MNEAEYLMKNCGDRGGCYPSRREAEADNTLRDFRKCSPNSRCRPSSCHLAVLAMFLAIISPSSYS